MGDFNPTAKINRVPCWALRFFAEDDDGNPGEALLTVDYGGHTAEISLALEGGLTAGRLDITLGRLTARDFGKLVRAQLLEFVDEEIRRAPGPRRVFVKVAMYWKDPIVALPEFSDDRVIETFRLTKMSREVDGLDIVTRLEGHRAVYDRIAASRTPRGDGIESADTLSAVSDVLEAMELESGKDFEVHTGVAEQPPNPQRFAPNAAVLPILASLREQMIRRPPYRRGRSLYLIRDGKLHVGPFRPIPHEGDPKELTAEVGLLGVKKMPTSQSVSATESPQESSPDERDNWEVRCAGRMDIQPGDVVTFRKPSETAGLLGGFGLPSVPDILGGGDDVVTLYVAGISQRLAKSEGWITTINGVAIEGSPIEENAWDVVRTRDGETPDEDESAQQGRPSGQVAQAVGRRINQAFAARPTSSVGEIREHTIEAQSNGGHIERAAHSSLVIRGIDDLGGPRQARLDEILRDPDPDVQPNVPYLTNFAWGPFGHVLPRYPGMRVMMLNHRSNPNDPVEIGALWRTDSDEPSKSPTNNELGDWWLILPAYGADDPPTPPDGHDPVTPAPDLKASHDLITAKGQRAIEVNGFTVRSHEPASLTAPADRPVIPTDDDEGGILIEQVDGKAKLKMLKDGTISIEQGDEGEQSKIVMLSDGTIEIEAKGDLKLKGNNIQLVARGSGTVDASNE